MTPRDITFYESWPQKNLNAGSEGKGRFGIGVLKLKLKMKKSVLYQFYSNSTQQG